MTNQKPQRYVFYLPMYAEDPDGKCFIQIVSGGIHLSNFNDATVTQIKYLCAQYEKELIIGPSGWGDSRNESIKLSSDDYVAIPLETAKIMLA